MPAERTLYRDLLTDIKTRARERTGAAVTNFQTTLPAPHAALAAGLPSIESIEAEFAEHKKHKTPARKTPQKTITPKTHKTKTHKPARRRA